MTRREPAQALSELAIVLPVLLTLIVGGAVILVLLAQGWAAQRSLEYLGAVITAGDGYDGDIQDAFVAHAAELTLDLAPATDGLAIVVTRPSGAAGCGAETCVYGWGDDVAVAYGDLVRIEVDKDVDIPFLTALIDPLFPDGLHVTGSWTGIVQRDTPESGATIVEPEVGGGIHGVITTQMGCAGAPPCPIADATVTLATDPAVSRSTGAQGRYRFREVPAGGYLLTVEAPGYATQSAMVSVATGAVTQQDVELTGAVEINACIYDDGGSSVHDAEVTTQDGLQGTDEDGDGCWILRVVPGTYTITAQVLSTGAIGQEPERDYQDDEALAITVTVPAP